jgi:hypothetical protein
MNSKQVLDRPPQGWFILEVMRRRRRAWDWVALMIDVDPDDFYAGRKNLTAPSCSVRIPGKHKTYDAAREAAEDMIATRH